MMPQNVLTERHVRLDHMALLLDLASGAEAVVRYAASLARCYGSKITLVHAYAPELYLYVPGEPLPMWPESDLPLREAAQKQADALIQQLQVQDVVTGVLISDLSIPDLLEDLEARRPDLLLLAPHGRRGIRKLLAGSVTEQIFRRAQWPVLVLPPACVEAKTEQQAALKRVLYATDLSLQSAPALNCAAGLAEDHAGELRVLYAEPDEKHDFTFDRLIALQKLEDWLHQQKAEPSAAVGRADCVVRFGEPWKQISECAREWSADMIVMGARGMGAAAGLASHFVGGTAYQVACSAPCPVLMVPEKVVNTM
jgi:nucleotide-binding universal stress UspA family protein